MTECLSCNIPRISLISLKTFSNNKWVETSVTEVPINYDSMPVKWPDFLVYVVAKLVCSTILMGLIVVDR